MKGRALRLGLAVVGLAVAWGATAAAQQEPERPRGKGAAIVVDSEWIWAGAGTRIFREPDAGSGHLAYVEVRMELEVLERREGWIRVRHGAMNGWISTTGEAAGGGAPVTRVTEIDRQLARALEIFRLEASPEPYGEFAFYTDVKDKRVLSILEKTSRRLPEAYEARYGLEGKPSVREAILLFAREAEYRAFVLESFGDSARHRPDLRGHSASGIAVLYVGDYSPEEVAAVLVHELTHLLNRRVFPVRLPPWLEEGLANDLGFCRIDARGRLRLATLGGRGVMIEQPEYDERGFLRIDRRVNLTGPLASLRTVQERWNSPESPSAAELTQLEWDQFIEPGNRRLHYAASAFLIRYLLDSGDGGLRNDRLANGFRSFLRSIAAGEPAGPEVLASHLTRDRDQVPDRSSGGATDDAFTGVSHRDFEELDTGFAHWLAAQR